MSIAEWTHLSVITDRLGSLKCQAQAAVAAGDSDTAGYFYDLIKMADQDRKRTVERLLADALAMAPETR
jgi:DICT domain-containing protein